MDGTLISIRKRFCSVHREVCKKLEILPCSNEEYWHAKCKGIPSLEILKKQGGEQHWRHYKLLRNQLIENKHFLEMDTLRTGTIIALNALEKLYTLVILSGRASKQQLQWQLKLLKIDHLFYRVYVVSPYSSLEEKTALLRRLSSTDDIIIGDTPTDILSGKAVKRHTVAITGGLSTKERLVQSSPDYIVHQLIDIFRICSSFPRTGASASS